MTALHLAARFGHTEVVKFFHETLGWSLDGGDRTPLHFAALRSRLETAEYLIQSGALVDSLTRGRYQTDKTPLMYAASQGKTEMVKLLIKYGANVNAYVDKNIVTYL